MARQLLLHSHEDGFSIIEAMLAIAIVVLVVTTFAGAVVLAQQNTTQGARRTKASMLAEEGLEAARSIQDNAFNELKYNQSAIEITGNEWNFKGEGTSEIIDGEYTRTITLSSVCRDGADDIAPCPSIYVDPHTLKLSATVSWQEPRAGTQSVVDETYISNWESENWVQTDWYGGSGQTLWSDSTRYNTDNGNIDTTTPGEVKLQTVSTGGCTGASWTFDTPTDYTYDSGKIEVIGGQAQLQEGGSAMDGGQTQEPAFDNGGPWNTGTWDIGSGETSSTTIHPNDGNPDNWVYTYLTARKNREVGGYIEQSFITTVDNPDSVQIELDYQPWSLNIGPNDHAYFYVFVENTQGAPASISNAVWSHEFTGADSLQAWQSGVSIDATSAVTTQGTYYLKLALWLDTAKTSGNPTRSVIGGYDNAQLTWSKTGTAYPVDRPTISNTTSFQPSSVNAWTSFTETATKNGGEIYYQISDDDGATWYYWNGTVWGVASATDYNTATEINTNLQAFDSSNGSLMFKAFLESDGTQLVQLDEVELGCGNLQMEAGTITTDETWTAITLNNAYTSPVVVASYDESANTLPASVRISNVSPTGFDIRLQHPADQDIASDLITYVVMEEGLWYIDGKQFEARTYNTNTVARKGLWSGDTVNFTKNFTSTPIVAHQVMSNNDTNWITTFVASPTSVSSPPSTTGMQIAMNGAEAETSHGTETIGWIAIGSNRTGTIDSHAFETYQTSSSVRGHDNGCYAFNYQNTYSSPPLVLGYQQTMKGGDGSWSVTCNNTATQASFHDEEDQENDNERSHIAEVDGFFAFDQAFSYSGQSGSAGVYETSGSLESSAYNSSAASQIQEIEWDETIPNCTPACTVKLQVRAAPDSGGSPGSWSSWYGSTGAGSYFSSSDGTRIETDLNGNQWIQYRFELGGDGTATPIIEEVRINYK